MKKFKAFSKRLLKNKKGQGMVEYILILVVVVAIVSIMKKQLTSYVTTDMYGKLTSAIGGVFDN